LDAVTVTGSLRLEKFLHRTAKFALGSWTKNSATVQDAYGVNTPSREVIAGVEFNMSIETIVIVVVLVLLFGGGGFFYSRRGRR